MNNIPNGGDNHLVVFTTPTILPLEAITTMGLSAKPNSTSPIGYFGTGMKYAIAVLLRHKLEVTLYIGAEEFRFYTKDKEFRGVAYSQVWMKHRTISNARWKYKQLPFTTEYGKNWKLWMAFRELESNTRDEQGSTQRLEHLADFDPLDIEGDQMTMWVVQGKEFCDVYDVRNSIFYPTKKEEQLLDHNGIEVYNEPSSYVYYRGMRVLDLQKSSKFTYNLTCMMALTEDRTISSWDLKRKIAEAIVQCDNAHLIEQCTKEDTKSFEGELEFDYVYVGMSDTFKRVVGGMGKRPSRVQSYWQRYTPSVPRMTDRDALEVVWKFLDAIVHRQDPTEAEQGNEPFLVNAFVGSTDLNGCTGVSIAKLDSIAEYLEKEPLGNHKPLKAPITPVTTETEDKDFAAKFDNEIPF